MVRHTLESIRPGIRILEVVATRGKHVRAEPIAALYSTGRVSHIGTFPQLEDQMCQMTAAGYEGNGSPDRCDALVWAMTELFPQLVRPKSAVTWDDTGGGGSWLSA
jgi:phage terminase large subunit-like protein